MRLLVIGNSHAATLRRAFPAVQDRLPGATLSFWGLPGGAFDKAAVDADGVLRADPADRVSARKMAQWNDSDHADLQQADRIFLVGMRFRLRSVLGLLRGLQPLDRGRRAGALGVTDGFLRAVIRAEVDSGLSAQLARTPPDARMTVMPAPYPAQAVTQRNLPGDLFEPVTAAAHALPDAARLMALFEAEIEAACSARGVGLVLQPRETLAGPFLTQNRFAEDLARDARHMNSDYGQIALRALIDAPALSAPTPRLTPA